MTLIVRNISDSYRVAFSTDNYVGSSQLPPFVNLGPGSREVVNDEDLEGWPTSAKSELAGYVQAGILTVTELTDVHTVRDRGHVLPAFSAKDLDSAIAAALVFKEVYNAHASNGGVHAAGDAANLVVAADPTDLLTLQAYVTTVQGNYDAHILVTPAVHPTADAVNATTIVVADLATSIDALKELYGLFYRHKKQFSAVATVALTPPQIMSYTAP